MDNRPKTLIDYFEYHAKARAGALAPGRYLILLDPMTIHDHKDDPEYLTALDILSMSAVLQAEDAAAGLVRKCRQCGCTDARACINGCYWVAGDLCSACDAAEESDAPPATKPQKGLNFETE